MKNMRQPTVMDLFDKMENKELNNEMKEIVEDEIVPDNVSVLDIKEVITNLNGIVEVRYGNETYRIWKVEFIISLIIKYLKDKYPNSMIVRELNDIDITIMDNETDEIIPVEIQKTNLGSNKKFAHTEFEKSIRKQLEDNIDNCNKCWFFFDSEYLRYLHSGSFGSTTSINMTWIIDLMRENKLRVFTIKYDGVVKELSTKDFDFLKDISQTCVIGYDNDKRVLNRNKFKIYKNIRIGYKFTQNEIDDFYKEFDNNHDKKERAGSASFFTKYGNERCKLYGHIIHSIGALPGINNMLDMKNGTDNPNNRICATHLGILEVVGNHNSGPRGNNMKFIDKFNVCKYFPGYLRQEKHWLTYKGNIIDGRTFRNMCNGMYKNAKTIFDY